MGYDTYFKGRFSLNVPLKPEHKAYLQRYTRCPHLPLDEERLKVYPDPLREAVGLPIGKYGIYFTGDIDDDAYDDICLYKDTYDSSYHCYRRKMLSTPEAQAEAAFLAPASGCQWVPTADGRGIEEEGEKFYYYDEWLRFLLKHFLLPWGYELSGEVFYQGEQGEHGRILVVDNEVQVVVDGDSLLPRSKKSSAIEEVQETHWMTIGSLSDGAQQALLDAGSVVMNVHEDPPVVLVGISYDCNYYKRYGYDDLAIWTTEGICLYSKNLRLEWSFNKFPGKRWYGFLDMRLILPGEPFVSPFDMEEDLKELEELAMEEVQETHWMTIGSLSDGARQALLDAGAVVVNVHNDPPVVLIGISYDGNYYKRHGHKDLTIVKKEGMYQESKNLRLAWSCNDFPGKRWNGFLEKRLILPDEPDEPRFFKEEDLKDPGEE